MIKNKEKHLERTIKILIIVFIISILIRIVLAIIVGEYVTFRDELLHLNIAKALANKEGIAFRGYHVKRYDILYSLLISIATLTTNAELEHILVMIINTVLMSSVIFPVYFLSRSLRLNIKSTYIISVLSLCVPEMIYTSSVLQENLMYPLAIWYLFLFMRLYENINKNIVVLSFSTFILCLVKDFGLAFFTGTVLFFIFELILKTKDRRSLAKVLFVYIFSFGMIWLIYRRGIQFITYESTMIAVQQSIFTSIFSTILNPSKLLRLIYPFIIYCLLTISFYAIFPILIPLSQYNKLEKKERELLSLSIFILLSYIAVTCIVITSQENYNSLNLRIHYRYYFFMIIPIYMVFLSMMEKVKRSINLFILLFLYLFILMIVEVPLMFGSPIDCPIANILSWFDGEMLKETVVILIVLFSVFCMYLLYCKKNKFMFIVVFITIFFGFIIDTFIGYKILYREKNANQERRNCVLQINDYIENNVNSAEDLLIVVGNDEQKIFYLESYLQQPYKVAMKDAFLTYINSAESDIYLEGFSQKFINKMETVPTYIITQEYMKIQGYSMIPLYSTDYLLYVSGNSEIQYNEEPVIYGRYSDNWINKECHIVFSGERTEEKIKIKLEMDTIFEEKMEIKVVDSTGYMQEIIIDPFRNSYEIYVNKMPNEVSYEITLSTENNYNPNNGDPRKLSFRIYDIVKIKE